MSELGLDRSEDCLDLAREHNLVELWNHLARSETSERTAALACLVGLVTRFSRWESLPDGQVECFFAAAPKSVVPASISALISRICNPNAIGWPA